MVNFSAAPNQAKYFAFLSYSHKDAQNALALSRYIETFRVPVRLGGKEQQLPKRMFPIFRDRDEFSASSDLGVAIQGALARSGALIVLCSPAAAQSRWVDEEIRTFRRTGNPKRIFPVLLEGEPSEAFPPSLTEGGAEPLAVDFRPHKDNLRDAHLRLVAALLGIDFDALKRREFIRIRSARLRITAFAGAAALAAIGGVEGYRFDQPAIDEYSRTRVAPLQIASGPDGNLWFTEFVAKQDLVSGRSAIGRITIGGGIIEYPIQSDHAAVRGIGSGSDGAVWFTEYGANEIGHITTSGQMRAYPVPSPTSWPWPNETPWAARNAPQADEIASGPDGALWFTEDYGPIGRITTTGQITTFYLPTGWEEAWAIAAGPDDAMWFSGLKNFEPVIGRIAADGRITGYPLRGEAAVQAVTLGSDGAMWFTQGNAIGRITTSGKVTYYSISEETETTPGEAALYGIAPGHDGALWFTDALQNKIGRITTGGAITQYAIPTVNSGPVSIVPGPDGAMWFTEAAGGRIGRITTGHWFFGI